jgi:hypothetical protein
MSECTENLSVLHGNIELVGDLLPIAKALQALADKKINFLHQAHFSLNPFDAAFASTHLECG